MYHGDLFYEECIVSRGGLILLRIHLIPSEEYLIERALLTRKLREGATPILQALGAALDQLQQTGWGETLAITKIGANKFGYAFYPNWHVTFRIRDQKPSFQTPEEMWLELLTLAVRD